MARFSDLGTLGGKADGRIIPLCRVSSAIYRSDSCVNVVEGGH
jgi:hypothetical protein